MRFLVSADIHLGSPIRSAALRNPELGERLKQASRDTFSDIVSMAIDERVDALLLAGDIFDNGQPDLRSRAFLQTQLTRAANNGIPSVLIRGNHDALLDHMAQGELGPMIHLLDKRNPSVEIGDAVFHGLSFDTGHVSRSFLPDYPAPQVGKINVGLMHTSLDGSAGHDPYAPCSRKDLMDHGYDLWCLGHIHAPFEIQTNTALAIMPGIPQPRHFGEHTGGQVILASVDGQTREFQKRHVGRLGFVQADLDLTECSNQSEVVSALETAFTATTDNTKDIAVRLHVTTKRHTTEELHALANEVLEDLEGVYLDKIKTSAPADILDPASDDLMRLMRGQLQSPGFQEEARQILAELRSALPHGSQSELDQDSLPELLEDAMASVAAALHKEGDV